MNLNDGCTWLHHAKPWSCGRHCMANPGPESEHVFAQRPGYSTWVAYCTLARARTHLQTFIWHSPLRRPIRTRQRVAPSVMHGVGAIEIEQNQHWQTHRLTAPLGITDPIVFYGVNCLPGDGSTWHVPSLPIPSCPQERHDVTPPSNGSDPHAHVAGRRTHILHAGRAVGLRWCVDRSFVLGGCLGCFLNKKWLHCESSVLFRRGWLCVVTLGGAVWFLAVCSSRLHGTKGFQVPRRSRVQSCNQEWLINTAWFSNKDWIPQPMVDVHSKTIWIQPTAWQLRGNKSSGRQEAD